MRQDWLQATEDCLRRARESRDVARMSTVSAKRDVQKVNGVATLVIKSVLPNGQRHNAALDVEVSNICDAAVIAAAQEEAQWTGQRESFMLPDGSIGSVDADGNLYDERPPQG